MAYGITEGMYFAASKVMMTAAWFAVVGSLVYAVWLWTTPGRGAGTQERDRRARREEPPLLPPLGKH
jgi:hypothetical protein